MHKLSKVNIECHSEEHRVIPLSCFSCFQASSQTEKLSSPSKGEGKYATFSHKIKAAFTLAEVLITLTIIGVIAALTIPNLMRKWEEAHTVAGVKEAYAIFNNAFKAMIAEEGQLTDWDWPESGFGDLRFNFGFPNYLTEKLKPYLKINKAYTGPEFRNATGVDFIANDGRNYFKNLKGQPGVNYQYNIGRNVLLLANGMDAYIAVTQQAMQDIKNGLTDKYTFRNTNGTSAPAPIGSIVFDINGYKKGPNRWGYDIFVFEYFYDGLKYTRYTSWGSPASSYYCDYSLNNENNGQSCGYWVLLHGNTDYQRRQVKNVRTTGGWLPN